MKLGVRYINIELAVAPEAHDDLFGFQTTRQQ